MYVVHGLGNSSPFNEWELQSLETFWQRLREREIEANTEAKENCHAWVQNLIEAAAAKQQNLPEDQKSNPPVDIKEIPGGTRDDAATT